MSKLLGKGLKTLYNQVMKKKMISIAIFILVVFIGLGFFLLEILTPKVILLPSEEISFALNKEIIYISEEKDNILTISTSNEQFKKPSVNASDNCYFNVIKNAEKEIQLAFSVVSGAQVYFELRTENYETARVLYNVTSNEKILAVEWLDEENNALIFETESNRNVMFIANQEHFSQAKTAGYICEIYIKCKINDIETNAINTYDTISTIELTVDIIKPI